MTETSEILPAAVSDAADALAAALRSSPPFVAFDAAEEALFADASAAALLERFSTTQRDLRVRQQDGTLTQADLSAARELERQLEASVPVMGYITAQQHALARLPEVNQAISELLGVNFAQLARRSSCC
jgi:cell fate (sporulation/competence/biofilm development) regulator YlbF (YheA/YmcA/DUF963 family)